MFKKEIKGGPRFLIRSTHPNVVMYGVFETAISKEALEKAVLLLADKHQLLNCRIKTGKGNQAWYVIDEKLSPDVRALKAKDINKVIKDELKHRFDLEKGPLARFTLLNQKETTLIINCHHAICDGMSMVYLFQDIIRVLSGKKIKKEQKKPVFLELANIPQKVAGPISRFFIGLMNRQVDKETIRFSEQLSKQLHAKFWKEYKPQIIESKFSKEETANFISQCKKNGVSVNTGLVAAFLCAEKKLLKQKDNSEKVIITVNLRSYLKKQPGESLGYFVSTLKPRLKYNAKKTFWENAKKLHKKITRIIKKDILKNQIVDLFSRNLLDVVMLNLFGQREDKVAKKIIKKAGMREGSATFTIANLGLIKPDDGSKKLKLKDLFGPMAVSDAMDKYISVLTINGELHFSICFNENTIKRESILKLMELIPKIVGSSK